MYYYESLDQKTGKLGAWTESEKVAQHQGWLGNVLQDNEVKQSDIDGEWYLIDNCPMKSDEQKLIEAKALKLAVINKAYTTRAEAVKTGTPMDEVLTWDIQRIEAQAWQANNATLTPNVDLLASSRGMDRFVLLNKIIEKVNAYEAYIFDLTGKRQKYEDAIKMAIGADELAEIFWKD